VRKSEPAVEVRIAQNDAAGGPQAAKLVQACSNQHLPDPAPLLVRPNGDRPQAIPALVGRLDGDGGECDVAQKFVALYCDQRGGEGFGRPEALDDQGFRPKAAVEGGSREITYGGDVSRSLWSDLQSRMPV
jgi:hypothetical protein